VNQPAARRPDQPSPAPPASLERALARMTELGLPPLPEALPQPTIDSHTHLDAVRENSGLDPEDALALAAAVGVDRLVQVGCDEADSVWAAEFAAGHPQVVAAVALHPNEVARHPERVAAGLARIERLAQGGGPVRAIGETGLDYFRTTDPQAQARQRAAFAAHIELAAAYGLTLVVHDREAHLDVLDRLAQGPRLERIVMHCFSGDAELARLCAERGYWISFPGPLTYKANAGLRQALAEAPPELILVETDAPYLTPVPARGRPNSTYLVPHTVRFLAEQRGWDLDYACQRLTANTVAAFGGDWGRGADNGPRPGPTAPSPAWSGSDPAPGHTLDPTATIPASPGNDRTPDRPPSPAAPNPAWPGNDPASDRTPGSAAPDTAWPGSSPAPDRPLDPTTGRAPAVPADWERTDV
jgi:TatD DNase family protein